MKREYFLAGLLIAILVIIGALALNLKQPSTPPKPWQVIDVDSPSILIDGEPPPETSIIRLLHSDNTEPTILVEQPFESHRFGRASISPNGRFLVYTESGQASRVLLLDLETDITTLIFGEDEWVDSDSIAWAPDNSKVAIASGIDIWIYDVPLQSTSHFDVEALGYYLYPYTLAWSPASDRLVTLAAGSNSNYKVMIFDPKTATFTPITDFYHRSATLYWTADDRIIFDDHVEEGMTSVGYPQTIRLVYYSLNPDGTDLNPLHEISFPYYPTVHTDWSISPDGQTLAYIVENIPPQPNETYRQVCESQTIDPVRQYIGRFCMPPSPTYTVYTKNLHTGQVDILLTVRTPVYEIYWSPDYSQFGYTTYDDRLIVFDVP